MFEQNPKTLGRTTSSWTHRLSFGELLTFQKAKLLEIIAGGHIWLKFGHFTFYTKLLDDNINSCQLWLKKRLDSADFFLWCLQWAANRC